jgi:hypothetical protein
MTGVTARAISLSPRVAAAVASVVTLAAATFIVAGQPLRSPWWTYADADAAYTGSALNLLRGTRVKYLDHPGLPLTEAAAFAFGIDFARAHAQGEVHERGQYVDSRMLDLDRTRFVFRSLGILIYLSGTLVFFLLCSRLFGHWAWGIAGAGLWLGAPALFMMSIMLRPDVALSALVFVFAYFVARAAERRSAEAFAAAGFVLGFTVMVKLQAAALVIPLTLAALLRQPEPTWAQALRARARARWEGTPRSLRIAAAVVAALAIAAALTLNAGLDWALSGQEKRGALELFALVIVLVGAYITARKAPLLALRRSAPFYALVVLSIFCGLALPALADFPDWLRSLHVIAEAFRGRGVNTGVVAFGTSVDFGNAQLQRAAVMFGIGLVAAGIGLVKRDLRPGLWMLGATLLHAMAIARQGYAHYFAPGFVMTIPAVLWLAARLPRRVAVAGVAVMVVAVLVPVFQMRTDPAKTIAYEQRAIGPSLAEIRRRLRPHDVALTAYTWPEPDNRYFLDVQFYVNYTPLYPYRFLPAWSAARPVMEQRGLRPRYYTGPEVPGLRSAKTVDVWDYGAIRIRAVRGFPYAAEIVSSSAAPTG